jgi:hypothetical protein
MADKWRQQLQADLALVVDESLCIVLEAGLMERKRVTLTNCDALADAMTLARVFVQASEDDERSQRRVDPRTGVRSHRKAVKS